MKSAESNEINQQNCASGAEENRRLTPPLSPAATGPEGGESEEDQRRRTVAEEKERPMRSQSAMNLPPVEPWPEPVDGRILLEALRQVLARFVILPRWAAETLALWIVHTYAFELRDVSTYIGIESPVRRCGKTTLMTLLSELVNRPEVASNISSPAFFRVIDETRPSLLIDEADTMLIGNNQLRGILNSGYSRKMAYVVRVTSEREEMETRRRGDAGTRGQDRGGEGAAGTRRTRRGSRLARFSCWGPKAIAQIGHLPETLADRCIVIQLQRKMATEECDRIKDLATVDLSALRQKCARFVLDHAAAIAEARPEIPELLNDRAADIGEPLLVLSDLAGGDWPKLAREALVGLTSRAQDNNQIGLLLMDLFVLFARAGQGRAFSRTLVAALNATDDRPWANLRNGKGINDAWLADQLRPFSIRSKTMWINQTAAKGYLEADFADAFRRYISPSQVAALRDRLASRRAQKSEE